MVEARNVTPLSWIMGLTAGDHSGHLVEEFRKSKSAKNKLY